MSETPPPRIRTQSEVSYSRIVTYAKKAGMAAARTPAKEKGWKEHILQHPEAFILNHPSEASVIEAVRGEFTSTRTTAPCYLAWLQDKGEPVPAEISQIFDTRLWKEQAAPHALIWQAALKRVEREAVEEGILISPLLVAIQEEIRDLRKAWGNMQEPQSGPVTTTTPKEILDIESRIVEWIANGATPKDVGLWDDEPKAFSGRVVAHKWIAELFVANTQAVKTEAQVFAMGELIATAGPLALAANPHLTKEGALALLAWAAGNVAESNIETPEFAVFVELRKKGIIPSEGMTQILRMHARTWNASWTQPLAYVSTVTADDTCRRRMLENLDERDGLVLSTQGRAFVEVLADTSERAKESGSWESWPEKGLAQVDEWNLKGVTREDLLPLMRLPHAPARNQILGLLVRIRGRDDRKSVATKPSKRGGP